MVALNTITDDFSGATFDPAKWFYAGDGVTIDAGRAVLPSVAGSWRSLESVLTTLRAGRVFARLTPPATGGAGSDPQITMQIINTANRGQMVEIAILRETNQIQFRVLSDYFEPNLPASARIPYDPVAHAYVAMAEGAASTYFGITSPDVTKIYFFTSPTGEAGSWTERRGGGDRAWRPSWVTTAEDQRLVLTGYRASGATENAYADKVNIVTASAATTPKTSTIQENFSSGNVGAVFVSDYGTRSVVDGKARVETNPTSQYNGLATDPAKRLSLDYIESEIYVQGADNTYAVFAFVSGDGGQRVGWEWRSAVNGWVCHNYNAGYGQETPTTAPIAAPRNSAMRVAVARGTAATRYGESNPVAGRLYMYYAPTGTLTWTKHYDIAEPGWLDSGFIEIEHFWDPTAATSFITVDDFNLLTAAVVPTVPSAPSLQASRDAASPGTLTATWGTPANTGNSAILDYEVSLDGSVVATIAASAPRTYTATNQSNAAHTFQVRARNGVGFSTAAVASIAAYTPTAGLPLLGAAKDDFNDATLDAEWVTSTGVTQAGGAVQFPAPSATRAYIRRRGSGQGQATSARLIPVAGQDVTTAFFWQSTSNRTLRIRVYVRNGVISAENVSGTGAQGTTSRPYNATNDALVRIRHDQNANTIHLDTSPDGTVWTALGRTNFAAPTWVSDVEVGTEVYTSATEGGTGGGTTNPQTTPTEPTAVSRTISGVQANGSHNVTLAWSPPTSDGGSPITGYVVGRDGVDTAGAGAWTTTLPATARNQTFTLLAPGATYNIYVRAVNANGNGAVSTAAVNIPAGTVTNPATGATFSDDFTVLPDLSQAGTKWFPTLPYFGGGYAGAKDPAGNSFNAVPSQSLGGVVMNPFSIIDDASATEGKALRITCRRTTAAEKTAITNAGYGGSSNWVGGALVSKPTFQHGYFEWRMRLPNSGRGMFPAIWMYSGFNVGNDFAHAAAEIDMAEVFGQVEGTPWASAIHVRDGAQAGTAYGVQTSSTETKGWHVYGVERTASTIRFFRDGVQIAQGDTHAGYFNGGANDGGPVRMDVRINYTVSDGGNPGWMPSTDASTPSPLYMDIDYFRYYPTRPTGTGGGTGSTAVPTAPTSVTRSAPSSSTTTITWSPPTSDGGSPITGYRVARDGTDTAGAGPWSTDVPATARSFEFTLLNPSTSYTLTVAALNTNGAGPASTGTITTPAASGTGTTQPDVGAAQTVGTVNFGQVLRNVSPFWAGVGSSTFGRAPSNAEQYAAELALDARYYRIPVRWNGTNIVSSASGNNNRPVEEDFIRPYWNMPTQPRMILVIAGRDGDWANYVRGDAGAIIGRLKALNMWGDGSRYDIQGSNEPDLNGSGGMQNVINRCIDIYNDIQGQAPGKRVWGPVWSNPGGDFGDFFRQLGANRCAGIDWHSYPGGGGLQERSITQVWDSIVNSDASTIASVRSNILGANWPDVGINIDEYNWSWQHATSDAALGGSANTVMQAMGYCEGITNGSAMMAYATQNGDLSVMADSYQNFGRPLSSPMPAYWGIAALTGAGMPGQARLFPHYNDRCYITSSNQANTRVYAFNNEAGGYNIVVINRRENDTQTVSLNLGGVAAGTYRLFKTRKNFPFDPPQATGPFNYTTNVSISMEAQSVAVIQLIPGA